MDLFLDRHFQLIRNLLEAKVDFVIIGGYSVIYHGYKRTTSDIDIFLRPDNDNKERVLLALLKTGLDDEAI